MKQAILAVLILAGLGACDDGVEGNLDPDSEQVQGPNAEDPLEDEPPADSDDQEVREG